MIAAVNWLNLTTPAGLLVARLAGCRPEPRGAYWEAVGYRHRVPVASAFTVGSVVISRARLSETVWQHEVGHVRQYAWCGPMFLPLYGLAAAWSWLRTGDWWSRNVFERRAGLRAGGYVEGSIRAAWRRRPGGTAVVAAAV
jgi:hypothetical protein